jgi:hypothetical protein
VLELGEDLQPELRALTTLKPGAQHITLAVQPDADRGVAGVVSHDVAVADLDDHRVQIDDRVDALQRPLLPGLGVLEHRVGDL